jgi:putative aldouronate transport system permease protein
MKLIEIQSALVKKDIPFRIINTAVLVCLSLICLLPFIHVTALSFSSAVAADKGIVGLWPRQLTLKAYEYAFSQTLFLRAFWNTVERVVLGVGIGMTLIVLTAYPLSKRKSMLPGRSFFAWFFMITMLINGGLIPTYLVVSWTKLRNTVWALVIPGAVYAFNVALLLNFFRQIPEEMEESAFLDGAGPWRILLTIYLPLSLPALATLTIFTTVGHWNEWFQGLIYLDSIRDYPLQTYLQGIIVDPSFDMADVTKVEMMLKISRKTFNAAQIVIATIPIICVYPFLQKFFVRGLMVGSLKG